MIRSCKYSLKESLVLCGCYVWHFASQVQPPGPRCGTPVDMSKTDFELFVERLDAGHGNCEVCFDASRLHISVSYITSPTPYSGSGPGRLGCMLPLPPQVQGCETEGPLGALSEICGDSCSTAESVCVVHGRHDYICVCMHRYMQRIRTQPQSRK